MVVGWYSYHSLDQMEPIRTVTRVTKQEKRRGREGGIDRRPSHGGAGYEKGVNDRFNTIWTGKIHEPVSLASPPTKNVSNQSGVRLATLPNVHLGRCTQQLTNRGRKNFTVLDAMLGQQHGSQMKQRNDNKSFQIATQQGNAFNHHLPFSDSFDFIHPDRSLLCNSAQQSFALCPASHANTGNKSKIIELCSHHPTSFFHLLLFLPLMHW